MTYANFEERYETSEPAICLGARLGATQAAEVGQMLLLELSGFCTDVVVSWAMGQGLPRTHATPQEKLWDTELRGFGVCIKPYQRRIFLHIANNMRA